MILWSDWNKISKARIKASRTFKHSARGCTICGKVFKNIQQLRWHKWREHK